MSFLQANDEHISHKSRWGHYTHRLHRVISDTIFGSAETTGGTPLDKRSYGSIDGGHCGGDYGPSTSPYQSSSRNDDNIDGQSQQSGETPNNGTTQRRKIGLLALVVLIYYEVCGGPFGIEDIVRAGGPFYALVGFSLFVVWVIPEALITAEMSTAMPEASGAVAWVDNAFGPYWAFQKGWFSWLAGVTDNALYPILFLDCLVDLVDKKCIQADDDAVCTSVPSIFSVDYASGYVDSLGIYHTGDAKFRYGVIIAITLLLTYLNYRGLDVVGNLVIVICILSLIPFAIFCVYGAFKVQPSRWLETPPGGYKDVDWGLLLNTFFWNINFWESAACFSGAVKDPSRDYPMGMALAVALVFTSLFVPILIATGASDQPYHLWTDGYFISLAREIVGPWLAYFMMFASTITNIGSFEAEMSSDSWQIAGMADRGILPSVLGDRSRYDTPTYGILLSAGGVLCLGWLTFSDVVAMLNLLYCYGQLIEFAAFLYLRISRPDIPRPYRIPISTCGMAVFLLGPSIFIFIVIYFSSRTAFVLSCILWLFGGLLYKLLDVAKQHNWCRFQERFSRSNSCSVLLTPSS